MKIVIATDSFKGSLSTFTAGDAISEGIKKVYPDAEIIVSPLADGGEGTTEAITYATGGKVVDVSVCNPLSDIIKSSYGIIPDSKTAVIEMAAAAGITLIDESLRNPLNTTTFGVGEMIADAISKGCRNFVIGIGGSATNDGGIGMLQALGFEFTDSDGNPVSRGAKGLRDIKKIEIKNAMPELNECSFCVACDVKNVLCGDNGCSTVYGPQKGATPEMIQDMDKWLRNYAEITKKILPSSDADAPGAGAAGGLGFAFMSYLNAALASGIDIVIKETGLEDKIKDADIVITGEGRLDGQSFMGKAPIGVANIAKKYNKPVIAFSGCVTDDAVKCNEYGIDAFFPILKAPCTLQEAMNEENAYKNLRDTAQQVFNLIKLV